ncbi:HAD-IA family hydrolase [Biformimicrobium ophioploci]|uniref:N-acetylmuramic acid 6-phosphate phosphatase MupP n=1 Tax=Biformimicrobium ophioploci TaxID=3036711 RepID=A0ABQ6M2E1_9GAMM|nr:HAD-IA family hydrolase [Microbulbifer sp. NKW57]GMG88467.1 N-acetylmuramic acid 6-phosphate phosphatase MupP [Microbulbifer sp. NKW57]
MLRAVLFDLDGTLFDTAPDFTVVLNEIRQQDNLPPLPESAVREVVSNGTRAMVKLGFDVNEGDAGFIELRDRFLARYLTHLAEKTVLFPGLENLIDKLAEHGIAWGIVTNKPELYTVPLMAAFDYLPTPGAVICPEHAERRKPHPDPILLACRKIGCAPEEAIYVGDHERDIAAGRAAGMPTIACTYGYLDGETAVDTWGADHIVDHGSEIWPLLKNTYLQ